jgi:hypothetical protein
MLGALRRVIESGDWGGAWCGCPSLQLVWTPASAIPAIPCPVTRLMRRLGHGAALSPTDGSHGGGPGDEPMPAVPWLCTGPMRRRLGHGADVRLFSCIDAGAGDPGDPMSNNQADEETRARLRASPTVTTIVAAPVMPAVPVACTQTMRRRLWYGANVHLFSCLDAGAGGAGDTVHSNQADEETKAWHRR